MQRRAKTVLQALKDGVLQVGTAYDLGNGVVAAVYGTERGPQVSFFDKAV